MESIFSSLYLRKVHVLEATICHRYRTVIRKDRGKEILAFCIETIDTKESLGSMSALRSQAESFALVGGELGCWVFRFI